MKNLSTIVMLIMIAIVGVFTLDVYLPSVPDMANDFNVTTNDISLTFFLFSMVFASCQLFHGKLSDHFGRKPILIIGLVIAALSTLCCITSRSYNEFVFSRILQASGISVFVTVQAIIRDVCSDLEAVRIRILILATSGFSISIAPAIGGVLLNYFNWHGGFFASLCLIIITLLYALIFYKETNKQKSSDSKVNFHVERKSYMDLIKNKYYILFGVVAGLAYSVHFIFIIMSVDIFMKIFNLKSSQFGYLMFIYGFVYFVSSLATVFIVRRYSVYSLIQIGGLVMGISCLILSLYILNDNLTIWNIILPMAFMTLGLTIVRASATTGALRPLPNQAGQASAGLNLIQFLMAPIIGCILVKTVNKPLLSLIFLSAMCSGFILIITNTVLRLELQPSR